MGESDRGSECVRVCERSACEMRLRRDGGWYEHTQAVEPRGSDRAVTPTWYVHTKVLTRRPGRDRRRRALRRWVKSPEFRMRAHAKSPIARQRERATVIVARVVAMEKDRAGARETERKPDRKQESRRMCPCGYVAARTQTPSASWQRAHARALRCETIDTSGV